MKHDDGHDETEQQHHYMLYGLFLIVLLSIGAGVWLAWRGITVLVNAWGGQF